MTYSLPDCLDTRCMFGSPSDQHISGTTSPPRPKRYHDVLLPFSSSLCRLHEDYHFLYTFLFKSLISFCMGSLSLCLPFVSTVYLLHTKPMLLRACLLQVPSAFCMRIIIFFKLTFYKPHLSFTWEVSLSAYLS